MRRPIFPTSCSALLWRPETLGGVEMMRAEYRAFAFSRHFHETFVIEAIERGTDEFFCGAQKYRGQRGDIIVINPRQVHTGSSTGDELLAYRALYPTPALTQQLVGRESSFSDARLIFPNCVINDPALAAQLIGAHRRLEECPDDARAAMELGDTICALADQYGSWEIPQVSSSRADSALDRALACLVANIARCVPLEELADVAKLSPFYLNRRFHQRFGLPPHQYLINMRIERARTMLRDGTSVVDAAIGCGFADQAHLTRVFRNHVGITPARYLKSKNVQEKNIQGA